MALLKENETTFGLPPFDGYWALAEISINPLDKICSTRLGLYISAATYAADAKKNCMQLYPETFVISGDTYDAVFPQGIPPEQMPSLAVIMYQIFAFIKAQTDIDGNPGYFADAEIVP